MPSSEPGNMAGASVSKAAARGTVPFARRPRLPLVPPPYVGESLSGWLQAIADVYRCTWRDFLRAVGLQPPHKPRVLSITPTRQQLQVLADHCGIDAEFICGRMTLGPLAPDMVALVHAATPCRTCPPITPPGRARPVEWLFDLAPWALTCKRCAVAARGRGKGGQRLSALARRDLQALSGRLRAMACQKIGRPYVNVPLPTAGCIELVQRINERLKLRLTESRHGDAVFVVEDVLSTTNLSPGPPPWERDHRAVSGWYAWHVLTVPQEVFWRNTRCRDEQQAHDLLAALFDPRQIGLSTPLWDFAMFLSRAAEGAPVRTGAEADQAHRIGRLWRHHGFADSAEIARSKLRIFGPA